MKQLNFLFISLLIGLLAFQSCEIKENPFTFDFNYLEFKEYNYNLVPEAPMTFHVIENFDTFNELFSATSELSESELLLNSDFNNNIAVTITQLFYGCNYSNIVMRLDEVELIDDTIKVYYTSTYKNEEGEDDCTVLSTKNIIFLTNKVNFSSIELIENGELVKIIEQ